MYEQLTIEDYLQRNQMHFDGPAYDPGLDQGRLSGQIKRVFDLMKDQSWRTLADIQAATGDPEASISAQLRHLRKPRFGSHIVEKRRKGEKTSGLWQYRLIINHKKGGRP